MGKKKLKDSQVKDAIQLLNELKDAQSKVSELLSEKARLEGIINGYNKDIKSLEEKKKNITEYLGNKEKELLASVQSKIKEIEDKDKDSSAKSKKANEILVKAEEKEKEINKLISINAQKEASNLLIEEKNAKTTKDLKEISNLIIAKFGKI